MDRLLSVDYAHPHVGRILMEGNFGDQSKGRPSNRRIGTVVAVVDHIAYGRCYRVYLEATDTLGHYQTDRVNETDGVLFVAKG